MATKIVTKNSSTAGSAPSASDLVQGELAVNVVDKRLYTENNSGAIVELGTNPAGAVTMASTLAVTGNVDFNGDLDVDGTTNLDVLDVDGAVNMATTLLVTGNVDFNGDLDVDGTTNLDVVDIDGAVDMASTLAVGGVVTANAGVVVDNITIDGNEIDVSSGNLTLDVAGDILIDTGANIQLKSSGAEFGRLFQSSADFYIYNPVSDKDVVIYGNDGGSAFEALRLDMSEAGAATFNSSVGIGGAPSHPLHITKEIAGYQAYFNNDNGSGQGVKVRVKANDSGDFNMLELVSASTGSDVTAMVVRDDGNVGIGTGLTPENNLHIKGTASTSTTLQLESSTSQYAPVLLFDGVVGASADYLLGSIEASWDTHTNKVAAIRFESGDDTTNKDNGLISFWTSDASSTLDERMRIDSSGSMSFGGITTPTHQTDSLVIYRSDNYALYSGSNGTGGSNHMVFGNANGWVGSIVTNGSATAYNTSSDYRLKEDWKPIENATETFMQLKPCNFAWKVDGSRVDGFLAHELQEVIPSAATGTKDAMKDEEYEVTAAVYEDVTTPAVAAVEGVEAIEAVEAVDAVYDDEGVIVSEAIEAVEAVEGVEAVEAVAETTESVLVSEAVMGTRSVPDMQGIDQSKLVPLLTAALQEAITKIESLEARLSALEA